MNKQQNPFDIRNIQLPQSIAYLNNEYSYLAFDAIIKLINSSLKRGDNAELIATFELEMDLKELIKLKIFQQQIDSLKYGMQLTHSYMCGYVTSVKKEHTKPTEITILGSFETYE